MIRRHKHRNRRSKERSKSPDSESDSDSDIDDQGVYTLGTDIYFYTDVDVASVSKLTRQLHKLETKLLKKAVDLPGYTPQIRIFIRSDGGDVHAGFGVMDQLRNSRVRVITVADGMCASAATLILFGGAVRTMKQHAVVLIHQMSIGGFWGTFSELKDEAENCERLMEMLRDVYASGTAIPKKRLKEFMQKDVHLTAAECLEYRIVHELACRGSA